MPYDATKDPNTEYYIPKKGDPPSAFEHYREIHGLQKNSPKCSACRNEIELTDVEGHYSGECAGCREGE
jgi:hypothetical protein